MTSETQAQQASNGTDAATDNPLAQIEAFPEIPAPPGTTGEDAPAGGDLVIPIVEEPKPEKKKRGRPKGSGRKPKVAARQEPGEMFSGGPPEAFDESAQNVDDGAPSEPSAAPKKEPRRKRLSPRKMAEKAEKALTGGFLWVVDKRYSGLVLTMPNPSDPTQIVQAPALAFAAPTPPESEEVISDLADVFEDLAISVTPWQSAVITILAVYGKRFAQIEMLAREQYNRDGSRRST